VYTVHTYFIHVLVLYLLITMVLRDNYEKYIQKLFWGIPNK